MVSIENASRSRVEQIIWDSRGMAKDYAEYRFSAHQNISIAQYELRQRGERL